MWINKCCCLYARDQILHVNYPTEFRLLTHSNSNFSVYLYVPIIIHDISFAYFSLELRKQMSELFGQKKSCTWYLIQIATFEKIHKNNKIRSKTLVMN